ncbi:MAG: DeoR/GlpR transcriptional regulator [Chloroflexi bacterium]|nr:DeoR/GlpR transcriptional regulator [Chloroflexota bacterium]
MMSATRRDRILELVQKKQSASVAELSKLLRTSQVTVRQDLNRLALAGLLVRTRGGALSTDRGNREFTFAARTRLDAEEKQRIGDLAASLAHSRDSIILDASTTALHVARALMRRQDLRDLTIITNGIHTALELASRPDYTTILTGGQVRATADSLIGTMVGDALTKMNATKGFFGARGISIEQGLTDANLQEINVKKAMVERCQEVIAVLDATKFGVVALASFAPLERVQRVITDQSAPAKIISALRARGVDVMIA